MSDKHARMSEEGDDHDGA